MTLDFSYERGPPVEIDEIEGAKHRTRESWVLQASRGGSMMADAHVPPRTGRVVVIGHGADNSRRARYVELAGKSFTRRGTAIVAIDAPRHGDRDDAGSLQGLPGMQPELLEEWVRDHRRLIDAIEERWPDVPLGYAGFSMGGLFGVPLVAMDQRLRSAAIVLAGSIRVSYPERIELDAATAASLELTDPAVYAPAVGDRPVLVLCADEDEMVSRQSAHALYDSFVGPRELVFMPGTHTEWRHAARWFRRLERFFEETLR